MANLWNRPRTVTEPAPQPPSLANSWRALTRCLRPPSPEVIAVLSVSLALAVFFALYTNLVWEDFFITYRYSENLARGLGLVYSPGEHIQGFTSAFNTLVPALFARLLGIGHLWRIIWSYRLVCLGGLGFAFVAIASAFQSSASRGGWLVALAFPVFAALEIKITAFTMSGQEAGFVLGFLAPAFALACFGWSRHALFGGLCWAGLMYSRPDGCVYIAAVALTAFVFEEESRPALFVGLLKSALVCTLLYLPWFVFTWVYYGTPVPHTVTAKYGVVDVASPTFALLGPVANVLEHLPRNLCYIFAPIYDKLENGAGDWPRWIHDAGLLLAPVALLYWAVPTRDRFGRMASLLAFLLFGYLGYLSGVAQFAPWYYPPLSFMSVLALLCAFVRLAGSLAHPRIGRVFAGLGGTLTFVLLAYVFFASLYPLRIKQRIIEWDHRRVIGLWLKDHIAPGDTVYLEPLGYIGYFSQAKMLDWPGLVSAEVVDARRQLNQVVGYSWLPVAEKLKPNWIVARAPDAHAVQQSPILSKRYTLVRVFDARSRVLAAGLVPGMSITYGEVIFAVFHRND